jgi:hypothetical protein
MPTADLAVTNHVFCDLHKEEDVKREQAVEEALQELRRISYEQINVIC